MKNVLEMPNRFNAELRQEIRGADLRMLCRHIETVDEIGARTLPFDVRQWLTGALMRVDFGVYVEDCLPAIRDAADALCWSLRTLDKSKSRDVVEASRRQLIDCIMVLEEELRLCPPVAVPV